MKDTVTSFRAAAESEAKRLYDDARFTMMDRNAFVEGAMWAMVSREQIDALAKELLRSGYRLGGYERKGVDDIRHGDIWHLERILAAAGIRFETHNESLPRLRQEKAMESAQL